MNKMEPIVTLIILVVAGLGVATLYVVAGSTLRRMLHREGTAKPSL